VANLVRINIRVLDEQRETIQYVNLGEGEVRCGLKTRYSAYDGRWYIWILALDGELVTGPIKLVPGIDLLAGRKHDLRVPQGQLFVYAADREPPTKDTIDTDAVLFYRRVTT